MVEREEAVVVALGEPASSSAWAGRWPSTVTLAALARGRSASTPPRRGGAKSGGVYVGLRAERCDVTRIAVVDPQPAVRAGLAMLLRGEPGLVPVGAAAGIADGPSCSPASGRTWSCSSTTCSTATASAAPPAERRGPAPRGDRSTPPLPDAELALLARVAGADGLVDKAAPAGGAVRGDPRWSRAARPRCRRSRARSSTPPRTASSPTTSRCWRCSSTARRRPTWPRRCTWLDRRASRSDRARARAPARAHARSRRQRRPAIPAGHAPGPDGHRAHGARRARVRHLLAPAQRAHHLPRLADRRPGSRTSSSPSSCTSSRRTPTRTSRSTSTRRAARSTPGLAIYDTMQFIKPDVATICVGIAMSMGSLLLAGGAHGKRMALPNSRILIHQPSAGLRGPVDRHRDPRARDPQDAQAGRRDLRQAHRAARGAGPRATWSATASSRPTRPPSTASSTAVIAPSDARGEAAGARSPSIGCSIAPRSRSARRRRLRGSAAGPSPCRRRSACR